MTDELGLPDDIDEWLERDVLVGERLRYALHHDRSSPFAILMKRAADEAVTACKALIEIDLGDLVGARSLQSEVRRYLQLYGWINEALNQAESAAQQLAQNQPTDDADVEQLEEMLNGKGPEHHPDS